MTTDRRRTGAHRFYDRLGFAPSHLGYKLALWSGAAFKAADFGHKKTGGFWDRRLCVWLRE
ncbi:hypothetical protein [Novosphingopyxis sp. YJ-S2-01]|uniref:hypothetical protein n=1 Tax=Novosphingopyxis sp. YJ-S2-01 TaxID=2794021 RepID=UPI003FA6065B